MKIFGIFLAVSDLWIHSQAAVTTGQLYTAVDGKDLADDVTRDVLISDISRQHHCLFHCINVKYCRAFAICATAAGGCWCPRFLATARTHVN